MATVATGHAGEAVTRSFSVTVVEGPQAGQAWQSVGTRCSIGSHSSNELRLDDPTVSRFHCEVRIDDTEAVVGDLRSTNGTVVDGVTVREALLRDGALLRLGNSVLRFQLGAEPIRLPLSQEERFGVLVGASVAMRAVFALLERAAATNATILLEGETGTGKGAAAVSIHRRSKRSDGPFMALDCSAIPPALLESELFGHERGSFTGAAARHVGAFEAAHGGTLFLDEIGELPGDLQPKLLRALENREIRRVGSTATVPVDIRIIAATNRNLRAAVNTGQFRADLYFRLAVVKIVLPALRQRPEDIAILVNEILAGLGVSEEQAAPLRRPRFLGQLRRGSWPGNVRELRNHIERCLVFDLETAVQEIVPAAASSPASLGARGELPYAEARRLALAEFDRLYLDELAARHDGNAVAMAAAAGIHRVHLYKLLRKRRGRK